MPRQYGVLSIFITLVAFIAFAGDAVAAEPSVLGAVAPVTEAAKTATPVTSTVVKHATTGANQTVATASKVVSAAPPVASTVTKPVTQASSSVTKHATAATNRAAATATKVVSTLPPPPVKEAVQPVVATASPVTATVTKPVEDMSPPIMEAAQPVEDTLQPVTAAVTEPVEQPGEPVVKLVEETVLPVTQPVQPVTQPLQSVVEAVDETVQPVAEPVEDAIRPVIEPVQPVIEAVQPIADPLTELLPPAPVASDLPASEHGSPIMSVLPSLHQLVDPASDTQAWSSGSAGTGTRLVDNGMGRTPETTAAEPPVQAPALPRSLQALPVPTVAVAPGEWSLHDGVPVGDPPHILLPSTSLAPLPLLGPAREAGAPLAEPVQRVTPVPGVTAAPAWQSARVIGPYTPAGTLPVPGSPGLPMILETTGTGSSSTVTSGGSGLAIGTLAGLALLILIGWHALQRLALTIPAGVLQSVPTPPG